MDWMSLWNQLSPTSSGGGSPAPSWEGNYPGGYHGASPLPNPTIPDEGRFWAGPTWQDQARQAAGGLYGNLQQAGMGLVNLAETATRPALYPDRPMDTYGGWGR